MKLKYFRPVSISLVLLRVYEKRLLKQLTIYHLLTISISLATEKNHSTATLLIKLHDNIKNAMKSSEVTIAIFTDQSKAFDTTDFSILIKLKRCIHSIFLNVFYIEFFKHSSFCTN